MDGSFQSLLLTGDPNNILQVEHQLRAMNPAEAKAFMSALAQEREPNLRAYALILAAKLFPGLASQIALALLTDAIGFVRWHACETLEFLHSGQCAEQMTQLVLRDPDPLVRNRAAIALGYLGTPSVIPRLLQAADGESAFDHEGMPLKETIAAAIKRIQTRHSAQ